MNLTSFARLTTIALGLAVAVTIVAPAQAARAVSGVINNNGVDISDLWLIPGTPGSPGDGGSSGSSSGGTGWLGPYKPGIPWSMRAVYCVAFVVTPAWCGVTEAGVEPTPAEPAIPSLSLADLSHVEPQSPTLSTQPSGWSVVSLPTNFVAHISPHIVSTVVLARDVDVSFTPIRYDWMYGDGSSRTTENPGASWQTLGVADFSETATSHRYRAPGGVTPSVSVTYSVHYRWAGRDWIPVEGTLSRVASAPLVFVQNADTVLVTSACTSTRVAPGCDSP